MTEQEKLAFELEIRQKVAEENRAKQRESKARWREKNREYKCAEIITELF